MKASFWTNEPDESPASVEPEKLESAVNDQRIEAEVPDDQVQSIVSSEVGWALPTFACSDNDGIVEPEMVGRASSLYTSRASARLARLPTGSGRASERVDLRH